jgi:hypothetical protein
LLAGVATIGTLVLHLGGEFITGPSRLAISLVVGLTVLGIIFGHASGWSALTAGMRSPADVSSTGAKSRSAVDLRGRQVRAQDIKGKHSGTPSWLVRTWTDWNCPMRISVVC